METFRYREECALGPFKLPIQFEYLHGWADCFLPLKQFIHWELLLLLHHSFHNLPYCDLHLHSLQSLFIHGTLCCRKNKCILQSALYTTLQRRHFSYVCLLWFFSFTSNTLPSLHCFLHNTFFKPSPSNLWLRMHCCSMPSLWGIELNKLVDENERDSIISHSSCLLISG